MKIDNQADRDQRAASSGFHSVRSRLLFWILLVTVPIYAGALYLSYQATGQRLGENAEREADQLALRLATGLDAVIRPIEGGIRTVAAQLEEIDPPREQYRQRILGILGAWPEIYGSTIAVEASNGTGSPFAPYFFRRGSAIESADLASDTYAYHELPWYRLAADSGLPVWSQPYFDAGGGDIWMVTYSVPFYRKEGDRRELAGVVTADLSLDWVRASAAKVTLGPVGMGWLSSISQAVPFSTPIGATEERVAALGLPLDDVALRAKGEAMLADKQTFRLLPSGASPVAAYLAVRSLETLQWHLTLLLPRGELLADARHLLNQQIWLGAIGLVLLAMAVSVVAAGIARPIHALAEAVGRAGEDDLDFKLPSGHRRDEIGTLNEALRRMRDSLQQHVRLRAETLAAKARLDHELEIAARIQQSMLPRESSAARLPVGVEIAAVLLPAREVGGDLFDYFPVGEREVLFAVGDVSDKGIPAALFMARLSGLLRVLGVSGEPPHRLLAGINTRLVEGNDACMFVTAGCGLLDLNTGLLRYASAGHDAPLLRLAEGDVHTLSGEGGAAIGIDADVEYQIYESFLAPGDMLALFTDGVTEAEGQRSAFFGLDRLTQLLLDFTDGDPRLLVPRIVEAVATHAAGLPASDDLTVLAVRFSPSDVSIRREDNRTIWRIAVDNGPKSIERAQLRTTSILEARGCSRSCIDDAQLIVEELLTNVIRAAHAAGQDCHAWIEVSLSSTEILLKFQDKGVKFNPLERDPPDLDADLQNRPVGGLGIHLVRQLAAHCDYKYVNGANVLEVRLIRPAHSS